jgi:serine-type D-Ala-D-Ala carboxypeptidase/endopeptidase
MRLQTLISTTVLTIALFAANSTKVFGQIPIDSIKAIIEKEVANKRSKSIIVGIVDANGRHIVSAGVKSDKDPALPDGNTIYELGSVGKLFTSLLMAEMSLKNELNYNDPVSKYLPKNVHVPSKNGKEITLLHLATHRSGLPRMPYNMDPKNLDNPTADYTTEQLYECISKIELNRDIDSKWSYSNIGYGLLGQALMLVSGKNFETLTKQRITNVLHMKSTMIALTPALKKNMAMPYFIFGYPTVNWQNPGLAGAGGASSTMNDMLIFAAANAGLMKTDLLPAMELTHVKQGKKDGNDGFITMGWTIMNEDNEQILWKDGATGGYRTFIGIDKKKKYGIVILSNTGMNQVTDIGLHILDSAYAYEPYKYQFNLADTLNAIIKTKGIDAGIALYHQFKAANNADFIFNDQQLYIVGNELRKAGKIKEAIKIFELNASENPRSPMVYESLGEIYKRSGNRELAIKNFEFLAGKDTQNPRWNWMINKLKPGNNIK